MQLNGFASLQIRLNNLTDWLVRRTRWTPVTHSSIPDQPQIPSANRNSTRVVRFGLYLAYDLASLPIQQMSALGHLITDPDTFGRSLHRIGMAVGRLEQLHYLCLV